MSYQTLPNVLVGINAPYMHHSVYINKSNETQLDWSPEWTSRPIHGTGFIDPQFFPRSRTSVFVRSTSDAASELVNDFSNKSMMSLDGIFSPISFYPTPYSATFNITKYPTPNCPFCFGTKTYSYGILNDNLTNPTNDTSLYGAAGIVNATIQRTRACPFCESWQEKNDRAYNGLLPKEIIPPYVIASGDDLTIITRMPATGLSGIPIINYATLNPIVLSTGEFSNFQNKQSGDRCGHSIDLVAFGSTPPRNGEGLRPSLNNRIERSYIDYDTGLAEWRNNLNSAGITFPEIPTIANNMRFFGLRGPVMLHAWGYDVEGYPVPNSSGEPKVDSAGRVVRDINNNILGKNQRWISSDGRGYWSKPYKEHTFYKGWAQQPGTWPVGPIDFRWDENARVWTIGANYKPVHIVIEEDLVNTNPTRGALLDSNFNNDPLPSGLRKLVFVKDSMGLYSAPRGAALYCKYDSQNGFYEPIGYRPFITSGIINSYNTVTIYKSYAPPNDPDIRLSDDPRVETYNTTYRNPLGYQISMGQIGLFTFVDGYWILHAFNCNV